MSGFSFNHFLDSEVGKHINTITFLALIHSLIRVDFIPRSYTYALTSRFFWSFSS
jgi:chromosome segregation and condensation protein ScpB